MKILKAFQSFTTCTYLSNWGLSNAKPFWECIFFFQFMKLITNGTLFKNEIYRFTINLRIIRWIDCFFFLFGCGFWMVGCLIVSHRFVFLHSPTDEPRAELMETLTTYFFFFFKNKRYWIFWQMICLFQLDAA